MTPERRPFPHQFVSLFPEHIDKANVFGFENTRPAEPINKAKVFGFDNTRPAEPIDKAKVFGFDNTRPAEPIDKAKAFGFDNTRPAGLAEFIDRANMIRFDDMRPPKTNAKTKAKNKNKKRYRSMADETINKMRKTKRENLALVRNNTILNMKILRYASHICIPPKSAQKSGIQHIIGMNKLQKMRKKCMDSVDEKESDKLLFDIHGYQFGGSDAIDAVGADAIVNMFQEMCPIEATVSAAGATYPIVILTFVARGRRIVPIVSTRVPFKRKANEANMEPTVHIYQVHTLAHYVQDLLHLAYKMRHLVFKREMEQYESDKKAFDLQQGLVGKLYKSNPEFTLLYEDNKDDLDNPTVLQQLRNTLAPDEKMITVPILQPPKEPKFTKGEKAEVAPGRIVAISTDYDNYMNLDKTVTLCQISHDRYWRSIMTYLGNNISTLEAAEAFKKSVALKTFKRASTAFKVPGYNVKLPQHVVEQLANAPCFSSLEGCKKEKSGNFKRKPKGHMMKTCTCEPLVEALQAYSKTSTVDGLRVLLQANVPSSLTLNLVEDVNNHFKPILDFMAENPGYRFFPEGDYDVDAKTPVNTVPTDGDYDLDAKTPVNTVPTDGDYDLDANFCPLVPALQVNEHTQTHTNTHTHTHTHTTNTHTHTDPGYDSARST
jgi:hypothetical protein